jgi:hypothetical protein
MPVLDLCSRLVVMCTRGISQLSSSRLAPLRPTLLAPGLRPCLRTGSSPAPSTLAPDSRRRHLRPRGMTRLAPHHPFRPSPPHPKGLLGRPKVSELQLAWAFSAFCEPGGVLDDAPCRSALLHRGYPASSDVARTSSTRRAPPRHAFKAQGAFRRQVLTTLPLLALQAGPSGRHWCPGFATDGPASDMFSRALVGPLDPSAYRLFAGALAPHAACRLLLLR